MERVKVIHHNGMEVLVLDYSGCNEEEMISVLDDAIRLVLHEQRPVLVLSILKNNYLTPKFMRHFERELPKVEHLSKRSAIVGLSQIQLWILKAVNLWSKDKIQYFDTKIEALDFLTNE